jgi:biopolymer transport protein TolQ
LSWFLNILLSGSLLAAAPRNQEMDIWYLVTRSFPGMVFWVLVLLVGFSLACWYIIGYKYFFIRRAQQQSARFLDSFWRSKRLDAIFRSTDEVQASPTAQVFRAGYIELGKLQGATQPNDPEGMRERLGDLESIRRALDRAITVETTRLESTVPFLATTGSTAPFIGLFGTVWGIMNSFSAIGAKGSATLAVVAPGIAEALIATAIGLLAAIPAVVAYNYFVNRIRVLNSEMETFSSDFLNIVKRHFLK